MIKEMDTKSWFEVNKDKSFNKVSWSNKNNLKLYASLDTTSKLPAYVINDDSLMWCVDLDLHTDKEQDTEAKATFNNKVVEIAKEYNQYITKSTSGTGYHIWGRFKDDKQKHLFKNVGDSDNINIEFFNGVEATGRTGIRCVFEKPGNEINTPDPLPVGVKFLKALTEFYPEAKAILIASDIEIANKEPEALRITNNDILQAINSQEPTFLPEAKKKVKGKATYICPLCNNGSGKDGDGICRTDDNKYTCFKCSKESTGKIRKSSVFDLYCYSKDKYIDINNIPQDKYFALLKGCAEVYNIYYPETKPEIDYRPIKDNRTLQEPAFNNNDSVKTVKKYEIVKDSIIEVKDDTEASEFLSSKGLKPDMVKSYVKACNILDLTTDETFKALVVFNASGNSSCININNGDSVYIPYPDLTTFDITDAPYIYLTGNILDSLSLCQLGYNSICYNGDLYKLFNYLNSKKSDLKYTSLIPLTDDINIDRLNDLNLYVKPCKICDETTYNSINEFSSKEPEALDEKLKDNIESIKKELQDNNQDTFLYWWNNRRLREKKTKDLKFNTGLSGLNDILGGGLPVGLTVLGALSSLGKTTLLSQIGEYIAKSHKYVLFFSLEQPAGEIYQKGLIRYLYNNKKIGTNIYDEYNSREVGQAYFNEVGYYYQVVECDFNTTVYTILNKILEIKRISKAPIIVIVDYLQALKPCDLITGNLITKNLTDKQITDMNIQQLKNISKQYKIPIITVSSLNRENYFTKMDLTSFKETGNIEYTSDIILGMDLKAVKDKPFASGDKAKAEVKETINKEYKEPVRKITITTLKNRFNQARLSTDLMFNGKYSIFYKPGLDDIDIDSLPEPEYKSDDDDENDYYFNQEL